MRLVPSLLLAVLVLAEDRRCAPDVPSSALSVSASVTPTRVSRTHAPDSLLIVIRVRNPRPWPVDVRVGGPLYEIVDNAFIVYADTQKHWPPMRSNLGLEPGKDILEPNFAHTRLAPIAFE